MTGCRPRKIKFSFVKLQLLFVENMKSAVLKKLLCKNSIMGIHVCVSVMLFLTACDRNMKSENLTGFFLIHTSIVKFLNMAVLTILLIICKPEKSVASIATWVLQG